MIEVGFMVGGKKGAWNKDIVPTCACTEKGTETAMMMMMMTSLVQAYIQ
jgi:hypothetical protein